MQTDPMVKTWAYRHEEIVVHRPYAVDVDADDWLWEGCGPGRITGHNLRTAELRIISIPEMAHHVVYTVFAWEGKLVLILGLCPFYLVFDPGSRRCTKVPVPASLGIVWYGTKTPNNKLILYERSESKALILDAPDAKPRVVACPFPGQLASGRVCSDGLIYSSLSEPSRVVRFDPQSEKFLDENPCPLPEATMAGSIEHKGILYSADSSRGRLLGLELATRKWTDPIPTPDHGKLYGFTGGGFEFQGKGYFCLSTYTASSRLDPKTGKIVMPEGPLSVDGKAPRFMDRFLVFDPDRRSFDYLIAPAQPDGIPLLCYHWTDGRRFVITGIVIQIAEGESDWVQLGPWLILQNQPAAEEPGLGPYDFTWDLNAHIRSYRRSYSRRHSLYLAEPPHTLPISNMIGPATYYPPSKEAELSRRAEKTDPKAYWKHIVDVILANAKTDSDKAKAICSFVRRSTYYNPIQEPRHSNPIALLEGHDLRCGAAVKVLLALFEAAGIESRTTPLSHHVVAEAFYDGSWHIADALFFGSHQPSRDGRVLSVEELKADLYFADGFPQDGFLYDSEAMLSEDGFQVLGYVFGPFGAYAYYSWYLGAEDDRPPAIPTILPVQRLDGNKVRLRWSESTKPGGAIEYDVRVFADRACRQQVFTCQTAETSVPFDVPEQYRMYYVEVRAMDDHRRKNPNTWYPPARSNFVLVPEGRYGWYGVM